MPSDDLLRYLGGPLTPSSWWLALAALFVITAVAWALGVVVWTLPPQRLRTIPLLRTVHARLTRHRFVRAVDHTARRYRARELSAAQTVAAHSRALRTFLFMRTGVDANYRHLEDIRDGPLSPAVPLLRDFHDAQFNTDSRADVEALGRSAERLIRRWT